MRRTQTKKDVERYHAVQVARKLGEEWTLKDHEAPDFLVTSRHSKFGLEVTECHVGPKGKGGSQRRAQESANQKWLAGIRAEVGLHCSAQLHLRYNGERSSRAREEILNAILLAHFDQRDDFDEVRHRFSGGSLWVYRSPFPAWTYLNDRVGWVSRDGSYLQREIEAKAKKLESYRKACPDVRLLVVADRIYNSGKLELADDFSPDLCGFNAVYFVSYPMSVTPFYRAE